MTTSRGGGRASLAIVLKSHNKARNAPTSYYNINSENDSFASRRLSHEARAPVFIQLIIVYYVVYHRLVIKIAQEEGKTSYSASFLQQVVQYATDHRA